MKFTFEPQHINVNTLFERDITYEIPGYQRPYSWDSLGKSETNNQVNVMWSDLIESFEEVDEGDYFLGSMVMIEKDTTSRRDQGKIYEVIDGQQRLTTLSLLFVAIKQLFASISKEELQSQNIDQLEKQLNKAVEKLDELVVNSVLDGFLEDDRKIKIIRPADTSLKIDDVLDRVVLCKPETDEQYLSRGSESKYSKDYRETVRRYYRNRDFLTDQLKQKFMPEGHMNEEAFKNINYFVGFLKKNVTVVRIITKDFNSAYRIFEILNDRGKPLSNKDLTRNFVISEFSKLDKYNTVGKSPADKWGEMEDSDLMMTDDFISRWVESRRGIKQNRPSYTHLKEYFTTEYSTVTIPLNEAPIERFFNELKTDLIHYSSIININHSQKIVNHKLLFLREVGNWRYSIDLILTLFRHIDRTKISSEEDINRIIDFLAAYEKYVILILLAPNRRYSATPVFSAIKSLNSENLTQAIKVFEDETDLDQLKEKLNSKITDNKTAKLLITKAFLSIQRKLQEDFIDQTIDLNKATLEHIMPQKPHADSQWASSFSKEERNHWTYKIGNFTLLTGKKNSSLKNDDFDRKRELYSAEQFPLNKDLGAWDKYTLDKVAERHLILFDAILEDLSIK